MSAAFPGLLGCFVARIGEEDDLGLVVGWADGYLVYATPGGAKLEQVAWEAVRVTGRGCFVDGDGDEVEMKVSSRDVASA